MIRTGWLDNRSTRISASILLAFFLLYRAVIFYLKAFNGFAWDYSINWTAALALREGLPLYDHAALQQLAIAQAGDGMKALFNARFTSFIGLPTTAMLHLPFSWLPFADSVQLYRALALAAMLAAIALAGLAVPAPQRWRAWLAGLFCLLTWQASHFSLQLGQVDAWVMLALAATLFAASRQRWGSAGAAAGIAVLLKVSPAWLLLYCLLQRRWRAVAGAAGVIAAGLLLSLVPQQGRDLLQFFTVVLPALGDSPLHVQNQALGAFFARLATDDVQLLSFAAGIGHWKLAGIAVAALLLFALHRRDGTTAPAESLATAILLALLAGPLTWDHYLVWAIIPVMLLAARLPALPLLGLVLLLLPLALPVPYVRPEQVAAGWWWRLATGLQVTALLLVALWSVCRWRVR